MTFLLRNGTRTRIVKVYRRNDKPEDILPGSLYWVWFVRSPARQRAHLNDLRRKRLMQ